MSTNFNALEQRYYIFDFDGTLIDSFNKSIEKLNLLSTEFGFRKITPEEVANLRDLTARELIHHLKIPFYKVPIVVYRARKELKNDMLELAPFVGIYEVLQRLYDTNAYLGIVTSNSQENVKTWLKFNKMDHFFKFIHSASNLFGKGTIIKKVLKKYGIDKDQALYIGDETRDIEAAKENGIHSVSVTWGFNSEKILLQSKPSYFVQEPADLLKILGL